MKASPKGQLKGDTTESQGHKLVQPLQESSWRALADIDDQDEEILPLESPEHQDRAI